MRHFLILFFLSVSFSSHSIANPTDSVVCDLTDVDGRYREHNTDFQKISLDLHFAPKDGKVFGRETLTFIPIQPLIDSVYLDAPGIFIRKLLVDRMNVKYVSTKDGIIIRFARKLKWEETHSIYIEYEATPRKGLYFIGWNDEKNLSRKQIWTQGQGIDNRYWFPCYDDVDDKVITETTVTFDKNYTVVSNGNLLDTKVNSDSSMTWHYAMNKPHAPYLVMLAIDKYACKEYKSDNGIVARQYYYADRPETCDPTYQYSKEMMDWLPKEIGVPYPWQTYSNSPVQDFMFGAMENTTATIYGDFFLQDKRANMERGYMGVNAHELTHQWFGDYITEWSGSHHWLHESFATYYSKLFTRYIQGEDAYQWTKHGEAQNALQVDKENRYTIAHTKGGTARHYPKGSFVIGMLRYVVGDEVFKKTIKQYLLKHAWENVDTHDFYRAFQETAGINLDWFFDEWVYHSGVPHYEVSYEVQTMKTVFTIKQTHTTDSLTHLFKMPIVCQVHYTDNTKDSVRVMVSEKETIVIVPNTSRRIIAYTLFDPGYQVLKSVTFLKNYSETIFQARKAPNMIDRYEALVALRDTSMFRKKSDLLDLYAREKNYNIKEEVIYQLRNDTSPESIALFKKALKDDNFNIRRAVIDGIEYIPASLLTDCEKLLTDSSYVTIEMTLNKLCKLVPLNKDKYLSMTNTTIGISKNVRIAWLTLMGEKNIDSVKNELVDYTSHSYEFRTRVKAMDALEHLHYGNESLIKNLCDAVMSSNSRLAGPAERVLRKLIATEEFKSLATNYYKSAILKDWQQEKLKTAIGIL